MLPPRLDELIPADHQVRFINEVVDQMDLDQVYATYQGGGTTSYHPRMLVKVLLYGYVQRIYSARQLAKAVRENVQFMWLAAGQTPDFRTINEFRKSRLAPTLKELFSQLMHQLVELGLVDLSEYFVDGTKVEANAGRYTAVWAKNTQRYKAALDEQISELFDQIQQIADAEDVQLGSADLAELGEASPWSSEDVRRAADRINEALAPAVDDKAEDSQEDSPDQGESAKKTEPASPSMSKAGRRRLQQLLSKLAGDKLRRLQDYERQEQLLAGRKSYSKTDPDATFMRGKHTPMSSMQLRGYYNLQLGTQNQFILGYSLHSNAGDQVCLPQHLDQLDFRPQALIGDAGYGTLANYQQLHERRITAYVKYPGYDGKPSPYDPRHMDYDLTADAYICPQGRRLYYQRDRCQQRSGQQVRVRVYESPDCSGCPVSQQCLSKNQQHRKFEVNPELNLWRSTTDRRLGSSPGNKLKKRRSPEVESVFGQLKQNDGLSRLVMRGKAMAEAEVGLKAIAHNLRRLHKTLVGQTDKMLPAWG